ncbi:YqaA family protein [Rhizobium binae]|uniref:YqaA family protein n=1 Tax=Rhizobium binae TaxID=1138190 RepID=UPI001C83A77C|nr:YqaA family protein [Rhizobium binae]MBX4940754.1 DedA family protein [Rhizobium binae]MBX4947283.1 DedA family protein [Rhizobium binae]MBX4963485.1 DedA family protein [Rhizobium binae]MBX4970727.1 DedA family protein [Rhizobium binae]MBX4983177.1 DedA family protein [Rhizobium binae]
MIDLASYFVLFAAALGAATILPMQSESVLVGLLLTGKFSVPALLAVASIGNTLGSIVNWFLGRGVERFRDRRWFPVGEAALERSSRWYRKYGKWTLLLSWMPVLGDALTVVAGVLREPLLPFTILVFVAKTGRYVVLTLATLQFLG